MNRGRSKKVAAAVVAMAMIVGACSGDDDSSPATTVAPSADGGPVGGSGGGVTLVGGTEGTQVVALGVRLSEGSAAQASQAVELAQVDGSRLTAEAVQALLDRLGEWDLPGDDRTEFERPAETLAPPTAATQVEGTFPPAGDGVAGVDPVVPPASGPLEVLRLQPEGDVPLAPFFTVTFNEPMVELATLDQLDDINAAELPVQIEPQVDGRWRWIGTRTLRFEATPDPAAVDSETPDPAGLDRLPAATDYTITVPAGTTSANGAELANTFTASFATPAPTVASLTGITESMPLQPVFVAVFDQLVDADAVLGVVDVDADGSRAARAATAAEIEADDRARQSMAQALPGTAVAFTTTDPLPIDTSVLVAIGPDVPSLEGPLRGTETYTATGRTYPPMRLREVSCGWGRECPPGTSFVLEFTNEIDRGAFTADQVTVEPALAGMQIDVFGNVIEVRGNTLARTDYEITAKAGITDVFGQELAEDRSFERTISGAGKSFVGPRQEVVTTDPFVENPSLEVTSVNHDGLTVTAWSVGPEQFGEYSRFLEQRWSDTEASDPGWPIAGEWTIDIDGEQDTPTRTSVDLAEAFAESGGFLVVRAQPDPAPEPNSDDWWQNQPTINWVQATQLGLDVVSAGDELLIWTTDLRTGAPVGNVAIELMSGGQNARRVLDTASTDADGVVRVPLSSTEIGAVVARTDSDVAMTGQPWGGWRANEQSDQARWYTFDDRGTYRPGETMRLAGWVRQVSSDDFDLSLFDGDLSIEAFAYDGQGVELAQLEVPVNALGGFNLSVDIPEGANLGGAWVEMRLLGFEGANVDWAGTQHSYQIQEFRTPEFEVSARSESAAPYFAAVPATVAVDAEYFAGGPLGDAPVDWVVSTRQGSYSPPNRTDYTFGIWTPWWLSGPYGFGGFEGDFGGGFEGDFGFDECFDCGPFGSASVERFSGRTDAAGTHYLQIDFADPAADSNQSDGDEGPAVDLPTVVSANATVFDLNRQAWSSGTDLLVHAAEYYVGARTDRPFVRQGEPLRVDFAVTDVEGEPVGGRQVDIVAGRLDWQLADTGGWSEVLVDEQTCTVTSTSTIPDVPPAPNADDAPMRCEFDTEVGGRYRITATVTDDSGRRNRTELTQWVTGASGVPSQRVERQQVTAVPDKREYAPGDVAEVFVQAPFAPATALVTMTRGGIDSTQVIDAPDGTAVIQIDITDEHVPNLNVSVEMVGSTERLDSSGAPIADAPRRPAFASGGLSLAVSKDSRRLTVEATPASDAVEPGATTSVTVDVVGPDGEPAADAQVALVVVDEAVLAVSGYQLRDPLDVFYSPAFPNLWSQLLRETLLLDRDAVVLTDGDSDDADTVAQAAPGGEEAAEEESASEDAADEGAITADAALPAPEADLPRTGGAGGDPIDVRSNFDALAVFAPDATTDANGSVTVDVELPDSVTRYRIMAVAVDGARTFGSTEANLTARLPLTVRPSAPRFANFGDQFELPVVVQNQTDDALDIDLALQTSNLELPDAVIEGATPATGKQVTVPANERIEVRFDVNVADVGTARFRIVGASGEFADAAEIDLPIYTPATAEAFATYGVVDDSGASGAVGQPVLAPTGVFEQFGGLEISTSSTVLQTLTDAVIDVIEYRYPNVDGAANQLLTISALRDVLTAFDSPQLPSQSAIETQASTSIDTLVAQQNRDGGWATWQRGRPSTPWVSIAATHALVVADDAGYSVPNDTKAAGLGFIASVEESFDPLWSQETKDAISAYALHVRHLAGQSDVNKATALYDRAGDDLQLDALAMIWPTLAGADAADETALRITNSAVETPSAATFATSYGEDAYVVAHSDQRTDGIVLGALLSEQPDSDLIVKVVNGLLANQRQGRWSNVYANTFVLLSMKQYFDTFEATDPDFTAQAWLGELYAAEDDFAGRSLDTVTTLVPMSELIAAGDSSVVLAKDGDGRLYYRLGLQYAPTDLTLPGRDEGFVVDRTYQAVDDPADVVRNDDGTWSVRAGATVRVTLTMVADARRTNIALVDNLPAGFEPINPALAISTVPPDRIPEFEGEFEGEFDEGFEEDFEADVEFAAPSPCCSWWGPWFEHQNLRDDRVEAFSGLLPAGTYSYTYTARATTPGTFVAPPARAEEIYSPEVFGRSAGAVVVVS